MVHETVYTAIGAGCLLFLFVILRNFLFGNRNGRADVNGSGEDTKRERELESEQREVISAISNASNEQREVIESAARSSKAERDNLSSIGELLRQQQETSRAISSINEEQRELIESQRSSGEKIRRYLEKRKKE